jgi:hypothetical protein
LVDEPEDLVVDCMKEVRGDESRIPVFVAANSTTGGGVSVLSREVHHVRLETHAPLTEGEWLFEPSVRDKYARRLIWPTVNVTVGEGEILTAFKVQLINPSPKRQWVKPWTLVGYVTRLGEDCVVPMAAMETYEDFVSDRKVVDDNNPREMAAHIKDVQAVMKENMGVKLTPDRDRWRS